MPVYDEQLLWLRRLLCFCKNWCYLISNTSVFVQNSEIHEVGGILARDKLTLSLATSYLDQLILIV